MSNVLIETSRPSANTVIYNTVVNVLFNKQNNTCRNNVVNWFRSIGINDLHVFFVVL